MTLFFKKFYLLVLEIRELGVGERERAREEYRFAVLLIYAFISWFFFMPWPEMKPKTLAHALTRNQTFELGLLGWCSNQLSFILALTQGLTPRPLPSWLLRAFTFSPLFQLNGVFDLALKRFLAKSYANLFTFCSFPYVLILSELLVTDF